MQNLKFNWQCQDKKSMFCSFFFAIFFFSLLWLCTTNRAIIPCCLWKKCFQLTVKLKVNLSNGSDQDRTYGINTWTSVHWRAYAKTRHLIRTRLCFLWLWLGTNCESVMKLSSYVNLLYLCHLVMDEARWLYDIFAHSCQFHYHFISFYSKLELTCKVLNWNCTMTT